MSETIQVPKGWKIVKFEDVGDKKHPYPIGDGDHGQIKPGDYSNEGIPYIRVADIVDDQIVKNKLAYIPNSVHDQNKKSHLFPGDILIAKTGATIGKVAIIPDWCKQANTTSSVGKISVDEEQIMSKFLYYFIKSNNFKKQMWAVSGKTAQPGFGIINLKKFVLPLPLLSIQEKIVQKLDDILAQLEEKKKQITELKEKKDQAISLLSQKTIGGIIIHQMKLDNPPKDWQIKTIDECADIQPGFAQGQKNIKDGTIHLRMNNIGRNFQINYDLVRTINATKDQLNKYKLENGDVVFNNTNSPELVGKSFIFNDDKICLYSNHLTRCRVKEDLILPEWLLFFIRGKWLRRDFEKMCNKWINQAAVGSDKLKKMKIPIPSLSEQIQIIKIITNTSNQFEEISHLTSLIKSKDMKNEKLIENLQSSILDAAFSGKLVK